MFSLLLYDLVVPRKVRPFQMARALQIKANQTRSHAFATVQALLSSSTGHVLNHLMHQKAVTTLHAPIMPKPHTLLRPSHSMHALPAGH